jgi:hypothetical protein
MKGWILGPFFGAEYFTPPSFSFVTQFEGYTCSDLKINPQRTSFNGADSYSEYIESLPGPLHVAQ